MPARKPKALITRHETAAEKSQRESQEAAMRPWRGLPMAPAALLAGHPVALAAWRRLMRVFSEIDGEIVTRLDFDLMLDYCMLIEQLAEMDHLRTLLVGQVEKMGDPLASIGAVDALVKLDGRIDRKRALLFQMRQSLYLTPRARAGVAPAKKEQEDPNEDLEQLLDEANSVIGNGK